MTVLIGVLCKDGIVIGADSSVTFGDGCSQTIEQPDVEKIKIIKDKIIVAGTGSVGLGQRFCHLVATLTKENGEFKHANNNTLHPQYLVNQLSSITIQDFRSTGLDFCPHNNPRHPLNILYGALFAFSIGVNFY